MTLLQLFANRAGAALDRRGPFPHVSAAVVFTQRLVLSCASGLQLVILRFARSALPINIIPPIFFRVTLRLIAIGRQAGLSQRNAPPAAKPTPFRFDRAGKLRWFCTRHLL